MTNITRSTFFFSALALSALTTAACGGESRQEARDPSTGTSSPYESSSTMTTSSEPSTPATTTPTRTTTSGEHKTDTTMGTGSSSSTAPSTMGTSPTPQPSSNDAPVVNNPGSADQTKSADNTKNNDRDRHGALTPMDQGNSGAETKVTAAIRKGIMADKNLSFGAKNVKVITTGTKVTLRGTVKSDQEKTTIADIAKKTDGVTDVDNQLEVKK